MANEHVVLCGGAHLTSRDKVWKNAPRLDLYLGPGKTQVHLHLHRLSERLCQTLPVVAIDLLEIASYVYTADQAITRGGTHEIDYGDRWLRNFRFEIPVRQPEVWQRADVSTALVETLGFLSDDRYESHSQRTKSQTPLPDTFLTSKTTPGARRK